MASYNRTDRIAEELKRNLSEAIRELKDPRVPLMTSVVSLTVTRDLKFAKVYVSVMGDEETQNEALAALKSASGHLRRALASKVIIRTVPELIFVKDSSIEHGAHINALLRSVLVKEKSTESEDGDEKDS